MQVKPLAPGSAAGAVALALILYSVTGICRGSTPGPLDSGAPGTAGRANSVLIFAGRMSTTDLASTMIFNRNFLPSRGRQEYDNDIGGVEYEREIVEFAHRWHFRAEGGIAERFGHYLVCCQLPPYRGWNPDQTLRLNGRVFSTEIWAGAKVRWGTFEPVAGFHIALALTLGLSAVTRSLGREEQRVIDYDGNAHLLGYVAPECAFSMVRLPRMELVIRDPHRSGAAGTFGNMREGYNANVVGLRYSF
jgi:hypothetical protein